MGVRNHLLVVVDHFLSVRLRRRQEWILTETVPRVAIGVQRILVCRLLLILIICLRSHPNGVPKLEARLLVLILVSPELLISISGLGSSRR